ncbi:MAG: MerR family transcriptional regulator [Clostridia bacterium]
MNFKIAEVARMLGITPQTLRFYENYGILENERVQPNHYRSFSSENIDTLMSIRKYRNCGFTVAQSAQALMSDTPGELSGALDAQVARIEEEINVKRLIAEQMKELSSRLSEYACAEDGLITRVIRPRRLFVRFTDQARRPVAGTLDYLAKWAGLMPLARWTALFAPSQVIAPEEFSYGFSIDESIYLSLREPPTENACALPACRCLRMALRWQAGGTDFSRAVACACAALYSTYGPPVGDTQASTLCNIKSPEQHAGYGELTYPIEMLCADEPLDARVGIGTPNSALGAKPEGLSG